jgi:spore maturation protein CgeB
MRGEISDTRPADYLWIAIIGERSYFTSSSILQCENPLRALVFGPEFYGYNDSIVSALKDLGIQSCSESYDESDFEWSVAAKATSRTEYPEILNDMLRGLRNHVKQMPPYANWRIRQEVPRLRTIGSQLLKKLKKENPDTLLVIKGTALLPETLRQIKRDFKSTRLILWMQDSITRYPLVLNGVEFYDHVYVFEPSDIPGLESIGIQSSFLPPGYDPAIYKPERDRRDYRPTRDLAFVGEARPDRLTVFKSVLKDFSSRTIPIQIDLFGPGWAPYGPELSSLAGSNIRLSVLSTGLRPSDVNRIYNDSKICLNLHHEQSKQGLNPRTFEIPGSGAVEVVDNRPLLDKFFQPARELIAYESVTDLPEILAQLLSSPKDLDEIAHRGHERARSEHTYKNRLASVVRDL